MPSNTALPRCNRNNVRIPDRQLFTLSLGGEHKLLLIELGGSAWVRQQLDAVRRTQADQSPPTA
jgi:hypothetical protein